MDTVGIRKPTAAASHGVQWQSAGIPYFSLQAPRSSLLKWVHWELSSTWQVKRRQQMIEVELRVARRLRVWTCHVAVAPVWMNSVMLLELCFPRNSFFQWPQCLYQFLPFTTNHMHSLYQGSMNRGKWAKSGHPTKLFVPIIIMIYILKATSTFHLIQNFCNDINIRSI